jgi:beta-glucanase (GH16 family)
MTRTEKSRASHPKASARRVRAVAALAGAVVLGLTATVGVEPSFAAGGSRTHGTWKPRPKPAATRTATRTATPTRTPTSTPTATRTATPTPTRTATSTPTATRTAVSAPASSAPTNPSGEAMPVGNVGEWTQIFTDNFSTDVATGQFPTAVAGKWAAYNDGWKDTSKFGTYMPSKVVSVHNGVMDLNVRTENGVSMVAAPIAQINGPGQPEGQLYGRYSVRFKSDVIPGYKIAWLLWPDSYDWNDGEIDFPEASLDGTVWAFTHHRNDPTSQDWFSSASTVNAWHTATIEWHPNYVRFLLDGAVVGTSTDASKIPNIPMHWVLQTETELNSYAPAANVAGHLLIDWVSVYRLQR